MASPEKSLGGKSRPKSKSKSKKPKHKIRHTHIEHGDDGSHVIRHSFDQGDEGEPSTPDSVHGVGDADGLLAHMQSQFGGQLPGAGAAGPAAGGGGGAAMPPQAGPAGM